MPITKYHDKPAARQRRRRRLRFGLQGAAHDAAVGGACRRRLAGDLSGGDRGHHHCRLDPERARVGAGRSGHRQLARLRRRAARLEAADESARAAAGASGADGAAAAAQEPDRRGRRASRRRAAQSIVVQDVSLTLQAGNGLGIIGPSGSGKSSLARMLVGVWRPVRGRIRLDGAALDQWSPDSLGEHIGYLPQDVELLGRHGGAEHRALSSRSQIPRRSSRRPMPPASTTSSSACPTAMRPRSARAARAVGRAGAARRARARALRRSVPGRARRAEFKSRRRRRRGAEPRHHGRARPGRHRHRRRPPAERHRQRRHAADDEPGARLRRSDPRTKSCRAVLQRDGVARGRSRSCPNGNGKVMSSCASRRPVTRLSQARAADRPTPASESADHAATCWPVLRSSWCSRAASAAGRER